MSTEPVVEKHKRPWWHWAGGAVVLLFLCGIIANMGDDDEPTASTPYATKVRTVGPTVDPAVAASRKTAEADTAATSRASAAETRAAMPTEAPGFDDGTLLVGTDIQPGIYRTSNESGSCYFVRLSGVSGEFDDIIANDNPDGPTIVEILESDEAFKSERCGRWTMDPGTGGENATTFGPGTYWVGRDIQPGRYRNEGGGACYYVRLANFRGEFDAIIANENTEGQAIVDIAASDAGFSSQRCGTWSKIE
ncbi:MAG: hypothetical protein IPG72_15130 [Ardenticatenales bacterium]|nr:hypothetical protein [Ardenticatenales bacterium]